MRTSGPVQSALWLVALSAALIGAAGSRAPRSRNARVKLGPITALMRKSGPAMRFVHQRR